MLYNKLRLGMEYNTVLHEYDIIGLSRSNSARTSE